jgi:predicted alpha/beta-hydrolase family hydrolase
VQEPLILFAHGAGAGTQHPWMRGWAQRLAAFASVVLFDNPNMQEGRRLPDRLPALIHAHTEALVAARAKHAGPVVLAGKSMGSRVGCHVANEQHVDALVCFGYPLCGSGKTPKLRDEVLLALETKVLFIQGTRDRLCPLDLLAEVRKKMKAPSALHVVEGGDHSLLVTKTQLKADKETQDDVDARIAEAVRTFVSRSDA